MYWMGDRVTIIEARDRIRGRVRHMHRRRMTSNEESNLTPQANSGEIHLIWKLALETGTSLHHWNERQPIYDSTGLPLPNDQADRLFSLLWKIISEAFGTREQMSEMWAAYVGEPVWKQSPRFAWMEEWCGYSAILYKISKPAREQAGILLQTEVVSKVEVATGDRDTYQFDGVVMTTPLGWLQKHPGCFHPPLPPRISGAIDSLNPSQLEKVFITFPSAFYISDANEDTLPSYTNWLTLSYHPTLLFYLYGDRSWYIINSVYGKTREERHHFLREGFHPYYSRLPGFHAEEQACHPKAILAAEWLRDDLCGNGSYFNFQVGIEDTDKEVLALREGCAGRRLWFCKGHARRLWERLLGCMAITL
ncbi:hypothetical protein F5Y09DRAFT_334304 [Xylaria sp. FL1042]|nr:hypothetical protein F5Y09DRAFT_334304 [Xylaria sp. FL1042]